MQAALGIAIPVAYGILNTVLTVRARPVRESRWLVESRQALITAAVTGQVDIPGVAAKCAVRGLTSYVAWASMHV